MDVLEWCEAVMLLDGVQLLFAPREHLVRVRLVPDVPNQPVVRCVEHVMKRYREFNSAETRREMPASGADALDQKLPKLLSERGKLRGR